MHMYLIYINVCKRSFDLHNYHAHYKELFSEEKMEKIINLFRTYFRMKMKIFSERLNMKNFFIFVNKKKMI